MLTLPPLVLFEDYNGDWNDYLCALYKCFKEDFIDNSILFNTRRVLHIKEPLLEGKEFTFWQLITEGEVEKDRCPDFRRCERIRWSRIIIENFNEEQIKIWHSERKNKNGRIQRRVCVCYGDWEYLVVLSKRKDYYLFCTAYPITENRRKIKLRREYEIYYKKQTPPF